VLFLSAVGALTYFANRQRLLFFAHAFFFITLLLPFLRMGLGIGIFLSDRYVYLPVFGVILMIVAGALTLGSTDRITPRVRYGILGLIALLYAVGSFNMSGVWKNTETLWTNTIEKYPSVAYSHTNRGSYLREQGRMDEALIDLNNAIALTDDTNARIQRGLIYRQSGRPNEAIADYNKALEDEPDNQQALVNRGNALLDAGRYREAIADYDRVIGDGKNLRAGVNRAIAYASLGDYQSAVASFAAVEQQADRQNYADFYMNRGILFTEMRQYDNALQNYLRYLQITPDDHQIMNDIGVVYAMKGDHNSAIQYYTMAIERYADPRYLRGRANSYDRVGRSAEAQQDRARAGQ
jgi:tetratricopeptide (TPR) repeat protein